MNHIIQLLVSLVFVCSCVSLGGCSREEPPKKKTTIEKLNSDNVNERMEGLEEASKNYGDGL